MKILSLSYDGLTDPLGQSQILPYIIHLTRRGHRLDVISFEKPDRFGRGQASVTKLIEGLPIRWHPLSYTKWPPVVSTLWDLGRMRRTALSICRASPPDVVHCRTHLTALVGATVKKRAGSKLLFDMRSFYPEERVEGGLWDQSNPLYRAVFRYFKRREKDLLAGSDGLVVLTHRAKEILLEKCLVRASLPTEVIPCCADLNHFSPESVSADSRKAAAVRLGIGHSDLVLGYVGSIGTWYMLPEMLDFFGRLRRNKEGARFLFVTQSDPALIWAEAERQGLPRHSLVITEAPREEVPTMISLFHLGVFFIRPVFSKLASSPTKQAELMAMGIPIICNGGVGDSDSILEAAHAGAVVRDFTHAAYDEVVARVDDLLDLPADSIRAAARRTFSLEQGVNQYAVLYEQMNP